MRIYHTCAFTEEHEKAMQKVMWERDAYFGDGSREDRYNNRDKDSKTNWIGLAGELTLRNWFKKSPWKDEFTYNLKAKEKDDTDFGFGRLNIDVKIQGKVREPNDFEFLYVYESQFERMQEKQITNALVFGFYMFAEKKCNLVGWIPFSDFEKHAKFFEAGTSRYKNGQYPLSTNDYAVSIYWADKQRILLPLQDLDRHK